MTAPTAAVEFQVFPDMPGMSDADVQHVEAQRKKKQVYFPRKPDELPAACLPQRGLASTKSGASPQSVRNYQMPYRTEAGEVRLDASGAWKAARTRSKPPLPYRSFVLWAQDHRSEEPAMQRLPADPKDLSAGKGLTPKLQGSYLEQYKLWRSDPANASVEGKYEAAFREKQQTYESNRKAWEQAHPKGQPAEESPAWLPTWVCPRLQQAAVRKLAVIEDIQTLDALVLSVAVAAYGSRLITRWGFAHPDSDVDVDTKQPSGQYTPPFQTKAARAALVADCLRLLLVSKASQRSGGLTRAETDVLRGRPAPPMLVNYVLDAVRVMGGAKQDSHPGMPGGDPHEPRRNRSEGGASEPGQPRKRKHGKGTGAGQGRPVSLRKTMDAIDARTEGWAASRRAAPKIVRGEAYSTAASQPPEPAQPPPPPEPPSSAG